MAGGAETLTTKDHRTIQKWAQERDATPATVPGTEHEDRLGVLRLDFPGDGGDHLEKVSWEDWLATFDERDLEFVYQETTKDGTVSTFFRLTNTDDS
jgi:hypothetical protein